MKINRKTVKGNFFAFDKCHKIYICENKNDLSEAKKIGYTIFNISELEEIYNHSCPLKFISNWKLSKHYVEQFQPAKFTY